jgi:hypothetical protein
VQHNEISKIKRKHKFGKIRQKYKALYIKTLASFMLLTVKHVDKQQKKTRFCYSMAKIPIFDSHFLEKLLETGACVNERNVMNAPQC